MGHEAAQAPAARLPHDWVRLLQEDRLPPHVDPLDELKRMAHDLDPADVPAVFANVDVPEID